MEMQMNLPSVIELRQCILLERKKEPNTYLEYFKEIFILLLFVCLILLLLLLSAVTISKNREVFFFSRGRTSSRSLSNKRENDQWLGFIYQPIQLVKDETKSSHRKNHDQLFHLPIQETMFFFVFSSIDQRGPC